MSPIRGNTVVYHVGAHKTGTSLLQKYMRDNVAVLRRHRIHYISRGAMNDYVGWGDRVLSDPRPLARKIRTTLLVPWFTTVIASHENTLGRPLRRRGAHLYPRAPEIIEALGRVLAPYHARIVFSIRPQDQFLESYYLQSIHEGRHQSFEEWYAKIDVDALSWRPVVDALHHEFGREHVDVVDFRTIADGQQAYIADFFKRIDPRYSFDIEYDAMRNPSISGKGLQMALAANPHLRSGDERKLMRKFLQRHFSNQRYPRPVLLSDDQKQALHDRFADEYEALVGAREPAAGGTRR